MLNTYAGLGSTIRKRSDNGVDNASHFTVNGDLTLFYLYLISGQ